MTQEPQHPRTSGLRDPGPPGPRPAVFLDRDGTMIHDVGYLSRLEDVRWYPATMDAMRLLRRAGYLVCVVTNQGGIGLGMFDGQFVQSVHASMQTTVEASGGAVDGWYFCPHHPRAVTAELRGPCNCRKPGRAMIDAACRDHAIDLARSCVIGDRGIDMQLAEAVGAKGILVRTGYGAREEREQPLPEGTLVVADLMEAAAEVLTR